MVGPGNNRTVKSAGAAAAQPARSPLLPLSLAQPPRPQPPPPARLSPLLEAKGSAQAPWGGAPLVGGGLGFRRTAKSGRRGVAGPPRRCAAVASGLVRAAPGRGRGRGGQGGGPPPLAPPPQHARAPRPAPSPGPPRPLAGPCSCSRRPPASRSAPAAKSGRKSCWWAAAGLSASGIPGPLRPGRRGCPAVHASAAVRRRDGFQSEQPVRLHGGPAGAHHHREAGPPEPQGAPRGEDLPSGRPAACPARPRADLRPTPPPFPPLGRRDPLSRTGPSVLLQPLLPCRPKPAPPGPFLSADPVLSSLDPHPQGTGPCPSPDLAPAPRPLPLLRRPNPPGPPPGTAEPQPSG